MAASWLSDEKKAALKATADAMSAPGKGFLASDESAGPWLRAGHVDAKKIPDTPENRAAYRSMLYKTPGLSAHISGVILHWETLFQSDAEGNKMVDLITKNGMIPGIKLDKVRDEPMRSCWILRAAASAGVRDERARVHAAKLALGA